MKDRERFAVLGVAVVLFVAWLGFLVHRSPRFPGSAVGAAFGIAAALLMLVPLAYLVVKRVKPLRTRVSGIVSLRTLLTWHIYAGIVGALLAIVHTAHHFSSPLGIALTASVLVIVLSGLVGRYLLSFVRGELHDLTSLLARLRIELETERAGLAPAQSSAPRGPTVRMLRLAAAIADAELALATHGWFRRWFDRWHVLHLVLSAALYVLLALHVWSGIYFGLRWLP